MKDEKDLLLQAFLNLENNATFVINSEGIIKVWSKGVERLTGYRNNEIEGKPIDILYSEHQIQGGSIKKLINTAIEKQHFKNQEKWFHKNGSLLSVEFELIVIKDQEFLLSAKKIDFKVQPTETSLIQANEKLKLSLKICQMGMFEYVINEKIIKVGENFNETIGAPLELDITHLEQLKDYIHIDDQSAFFKQFDKLLAEEAISESIEVRTNTDNPEELRHLNIHLKLIFDKKLNSKIIVGACCDITNRKNLEKDRLDAIFKLKEEEGKASEEFRQKLKEIIKTVCHEIRNPLNGIYGSVERMREEINKIYALVHNIKSIDPSDREFLNNFIKELDELVNSIDICARQQKIIVDDVLDLSRLEERKVELNQVNFNPKEVIVSAVQMYTPQAKQKNLKMYLKLPPEDFYVVGDSARLMQILTNLISNAIKFTLLGSVTIEVIYEQIPNSNNIKLITSIKDTGVGIKPEEKEKLFNTFTQANVEITSKYGGSGLGLSIAKGLIELMQGHISVESEVGQGAVFTFDVTFKLLPLEESKQAIIEQPPKPIVISVRSILVAEDNVLNQRLLCGVLQKRGMLCEVANDGKEAVDKCKEKNFDIIFMDIQMPNMNGLEATRTIRAMEKDVYIIGCSADALPEQILEARNAGMDDYLKKPIMSKELNECLIHYEEKLIQEKAVQEKLEAQSFKKQKIDTQENLSSYGGFTFINEKSQSASTYVTQPQLATSHVFYLDDSQCQNVETIYVVGTFNDWLDAKEGIININDNKIDDWKMQKVIEGWELSRPLLPGHYEFKYYVIINNQSKPVWLGDPLGNNQIVDIAASPMLTH